MLVHILQFFIVGVLIDRSIEEDLNINFQQHDYQLKFERLQLISYNKNLLEHASLVTFKYNRTMAVTNGSWILKTDVVDNVVFVVQVYKFMSNEYRYFPIHFAAKGCEALDSDIIGIRTAFLRCGNVKACPFLKGRKYEICNWYPDPSKFPPLIPNGQYKIEVQILHGTEELAVVNVLVTITRAIV